MLLALTPGPAHAATVAEGNQSNAHDSYQTKAPLNEALGTLERGSRTDPTPKNCDALTDRKTCKKKDRKKVTSNPTLTFNPLTLP